ncbi:AAA domain-containing protein [Paenibacillus campinasensis]|uniref:AAA domain-containing protein n=1 Tax=Paenibacillus campinasensis TaxID=66347 RepID=A0ABW9T7M4_9BACL|nr:MoxR family ATPase [Paenibacillus campinasensis]MUG68135.1 AAA domain-containing protein [Paenibacillus campinasensis]
MLLLGSSVYSEEPNVPDWAPELLNRVIQRVGGVVVGHREQISLVFISMLAGGHVLLEDVPGVGKTMMVKTIAACLGCDFNRIQFTYDLMPGDITGTSVYYPHTGEFVFRPGPVMSNIVLADEINRATPRAQSALLEAMEEGHVTVDGNTHPLPAPFFIMATQNPYEFEGTCPLPEAQVDRFIMRLSLGYPGIEEEMVLLERGLDGARLSQQVKPMLTGTEMVSMQQAVRRVYVDESIKRYMATVADASRSREDVALGISPRGTLAWMRASQAAAFLDGRMYVIPDDCLRTAVPVLAHRIQLHRGVRSVAGAQGQVIASLLTQFELPRQRSRRGGRA